MDRPDRVAESELRRPSEDNDEYEWISGAPNIKLPATKFGEFTVKIDYYANKKFILIQRGKRSWWYPFERYNRDNAQAHDEARANFCTESMSEEDADPSYDDSVDTVRQSKIRKTMRHAELPSLAANDQPSQGVAAEEAVVAAPPVVAIEEEAVVAPPQAISTTDSSWEPHVSKRKRPGKVFYFNRTTGEKRWHRD